MSDWLCRLSEGAGLPKRKLYTDTEEILIEAARPIMLTAIPDIAQSGDVIDRAVLIRCDPLPTKIREQVLLDQFEAFRPQLLGYLVEAASCALRRYAEMVDTHDGLRRGDWCAWVEAAAPALGLPEGRVHRGLPAQPGPGGAHGARAGPRGSRGARVHGEQGRDRDRRHAAALGARDRSPASSTPAGCRWTGRPWPTTSAAVCVGVAPMLRRVGIEFEQARDGVGRSVVRLVNSGSTQKPDHVARDASEDSVKEPQEPQEPQKGAARMGLRLLRLLRLKTRRLLTHRAKHKPSNGAVPNGEADRVVDEISPTPRRPARSVCGAVLRSTAPRRSSSMGNGSTPSPCHQASQQPQEPPPPPTKKSRIRRGKGRLDARARADHPDQHPLPAGARPQDRGGSAPRWPRAGVEARWAGAEFELVGLDRVPAPDRALLERLRPEIEAHLAEPGADDPEALLELLDVEVELVDDPEQARRVIAAAAATRSVLDIETEPREPGSAAGAAPHQERPALCRPAAGGPDRRLALTRSAASRG